MHGDGSINSQLPMQLKAVLAALTFEPRKLGGAEVEVSHLPLMQGLHNAQNVPE